MTQPTRFRKLIAVTGAVAILAGGNLLAGDTGKLVIDDKTPIEAAEPWSICDIFDYSTLYTNDAGPINKISLVGRYQGQWHNAEGDSSDAGWETRRWRAGIKIAFLDNLTFKGTVNLDPSHDADNFVEDTEELYIEWEKDDLYVIVGRQKPKITQEYATSSTKIKTIERSALVNQLVPAKLGGVLAGYQFSEPLWAEAGIFTGALTDDWGLPDFNGSIAASARIGYQLTEATETRFDYFYAAGADDDNAVGDHKNVFSWNTLSNLDRLHVATDVIWATGAENGDVFGIVLMPYYDVTDKLEAVLRYNYSTGEGDEAIRLYSRYERLVADEGAWGDNYHSIYAGLNYYICEDKLKLMAGIQWATLDRPHGASSFDSWTYMAGVRLYY